MKGLEKGNELKVVATGSAWIGRGTGSVESAIEDILREAREEIQIAAFRITEGGVQFLKSIENCLEKGIRTTLIINRFGSQPPAVQNLLDDMTRRFPHFVQIDFRPKNKLEDLHAKIIVVDRSLALIGSPNLSWKGLVLNHELGAVISGPAAARIAHLIDELGADPSASIRGTG